MMNAKPLIDKRVLRYLFGGIMVLVLVHVLNVVAGFPSWPMTRFTHLGFENNLPTWYSSLLLLVATLVSLECYSEASTRNLSYHWTFLAMAGLLLFMSCDEVASIHEHFGRRIATSYGLTGRNARWVWIGGPIVLSLFLYFYLILRKPLSLVPGSTLYLGLGFALIVLGGVVLESTTSWLHHANLEWIWNAVIVLEESLEMIGAVSITYAFLRWRDEMRKR